MAEHQPSQNTQEFIRNKNGWLATLQFLAVVKLRMNSIFLGR